MGEIILTDKQKECINNCYEELHSSLIDKVLSNCECCGGG